MGPKYNNRVRDRIYLSTLPIEKTPSKSVKPGPARAGIPRDLRDDLKRGSHRDSNPSGGRVLLHSVLCTKKRWGSETSDKLEKSQCFHRCPSFYDGGNLYPQKPTQRRRLACKDRLQGRLFLIPDKYRKFLCFQLKDNLYQFNCLPFGLASAPWVFTKTLKPIAALGRELGIRLVVYIDDILLMAETKEKARNHA